MELMRLAAFVMKSEVAACHSEVLPAVSRMNSVMIILAKNSTASLVGSAQA